MANKTIHELSPATTVGSGYEFAIYDTDNNITKKTSIDDIMTKSVIDELNTTSSNIIGAINQINTRVGSSNISNVGSSITGIIGNNTLATTSQNISGAVNELNSKIGNTSISGIGGGTVTGAISQLNSKTTESSGTFSKIASITFNSNNTKLHKTGDIVVFNIDATSSESIPTGSSGAGFITFPSGFRPVSSIEFIGIDATNSTVKGFWVTSNGQIQVAISAIPANAIFRVAGAFSIN